MLQVQAGVLGVGLVVGEEVERTAVALEADLQNYSR